MSNDKQLGVIFDVDGVLVDSYQAHMISWQKTAAEIGQMMTEEQFAATFGQVSARIIRQLWGANISEQQVEQIDQRKEQMYRRIIVEDMPTVPGVPGLLQNLSGAGAKMAIGSSGPPENVDVVLNALDIRRYFHVIVSRDDVTSGKPDPQVFLIAAEKLAIPTDRCVVIEDALHGIEAAHRAGMKVVAVATSHPAEKLQHAEMVLPDLRNLSAEKLLTILEKH